MKNLCAKTRPKNNPYEIWSNAAGWSWAVLKKYKSPEAEAKDPYARWFTFVKSPFCPEGELGDTYVKDIISNATLQTQDSVSTLNAGNIISHP